MAMDSGVKEKNDDRSVEDELVMYMNNLPSYLEKDESLEETIFNVGVLDWSRLQKWQKEKEQSSSSSSPQIRRPTLKSHFITERNGEPDIQFGIRDEEDGSRNGELNAKLARRKLFSSGELKSEKEKPSSLVTSKVRNLSPARRQSTVSSTLFDGVPKAKVSPLRRMLDPFRKRRTTNASPEFRKSHSCNRSYEQKMPVTATAAANQALLRVTIKNGVPLFTFAVERETEFLAATMKTLCSQRKGVLCRRYLFFVVHELKKACTGGDDGGSGYVPNPVAQMEISDGSLMRREFVMASLELSRIGQKPPILRRKDELAAIVVDAGRPDSGKSVRTTALIPAGKHGIPADGKPSPLLRRWKSGCDCGGWDLGCKLKILAGKNTPDSGDGNLTLFSQSQKGNPATVPLFSISAFKDGIYTVQFSPSVSSLQAFAICVAVLDSAKLYRPEARLAAGHSLAGASSPVESLRRKVCNM